MSIWNQEVTNYFCNVLNGWNTSTGNDYKFLHACDISRLNITVGAVTLLGRMSRSLRIRDVMPVEGTCSQHGYSVLFLACNAGKDGHRLNVHKRSFFLSFSQFALHEMNKSQLAMYLFESVTLIVI